MAAINWLEVDAFVRRFSDGRLLIRTDIAGIHLVHAASYESVRIGNLSDPTGRADGDGPAKLGEKLSNRELQVLSMLGEGADMREIALHMRLSVKTVETYRARIKQKLGIQNRAKLFAVAVAWNLKIRGAPDAVDRDVSLSDTTTSQNDFRVPTCPPSEQTAS